MPSDAFSINRGSVTSGPYVLEDSSLQKMDARCLAAFVGDLLMFLDRPF